MVYYFDATEASLLFQVLSRRYAKSQAIVLTSNKPLGQWADVFAGDAIMVSTALDRLLHLCTVVNLRGDSFRMKGCRKAGISDLTESPTKEETA